MCWIRWFSFQFGHLKRKSTGGGSSQCVLTVLLPPVRHNNNKRPQRILYWVERIWGWKKKSKKEGKGGEKKPAEWPGPEWNLFRSWGAGRGEQSPEVTTGCVHGNDELCVSLVMNATGKELLTFSVTALCERKRCGPVDQFRPLGGTQLPGSIPAKIAHNQISLQKNTSSPIKGTWWNFQN